MDVFVAINWHSPVQCLGELWNVNHSDADLSTIGPGAFKAILDFAQAMPKDMRGR